MLSGGKTFFADWWRLLGPFWVSEERTPALVARRV